LVREKLLCNFGLYNGQTQVLEWLVENGYISMDNEEAIVAAAIQASHKKILIWARLYVMECAQVVLRENLLVHVAMAARE
jgi:hypothetical protein